MVSKPPEQDPAKAFADAFGDLNALSLDDLDGANPDADHSNIASGPSAELNQEHSFSDARLDAPEPEPLRGGEHATPNATNPGGVEASGGAESREMGLDLALVEGGAVVVSAQDLARGRKSEPKPEGPKLEQRGATGVAAPSFEGPAPAGHVARPRGLFLYDPTSNVLAAALVAMLVAIVPAWTLAAAKAGGDEVDTLIGELEALHHDIELLEDPDRGQEGPQTLEAVTAALEAKASAVETKANELDTIVASASGRFWGAWFGLGLPLGIALSLLRRRA
jgi:hypothetical protein